MPVTRAQAKEICTKPELELVESSFRPKITSMTPARLRSKIERTRKLQDKYRDLTQKQDRETKATQPTRARAASNLRTERKSRLFVETRERFEKRLAELESKPGAAARVRAGGQRARSARATADNRQQRRQAKRDLGTRSGR